MAFCVEEGGGEGHNHRDDHSEGDHQPRDNYYRCSASEGERVVRHELKALKPEGERCCEPCLSA